MVTLRATLSQIKISYVKVFIDTAIFKQTTTRVLPGMDIIFQWLAEALVEPRYRETEFVRGVEWSG